MKLFCKHEWEMIEDTCHLYDAGSSKGAIYKCSKCGKESWFLRQFNLEFDAYS